jgi:hypothetical protein
MFHQKFVHPLLPILMAALLLAGLVLGAAPIPRAAADDAVVGAGTAASCTPAALQTTLDQVQFSGGGVVSFNCGPAPHTIVVAAPLHITATLTLDGGSLGLITLSGGGAQRVIHAATGANVTLKHLVVAHGVVADGYGGCVLVNGAGLFLKHSIVHSCRTGAPLDSAARAGSADPIVAGTTSIGGAIAAFEGFVTLDQSQVLSSTADMAGGIFSNGSLILSDSRMAGNRAGGFGGGIAVAGRMVIDSSQIEHNTAFSGGGIGAFENAEVLIRTSRFFSNTALLDGGGLHSSSYLTMTNSRLEQNIAGQNGGALYVYTGTATLDQSVLAGNGALVGGAVVLRRGALNLATSLVEGNTAEKDGGGIANDGGGVTLDRVTLSGNQAHYDGGGYFETGFPGWVALTNVTLSGNTAGSTGGAIKSFNPLTATHVTIANNVSGAPGAFYRAGVDPTNYRLVNVLLAHNTLEGAPSNCYGPAGTSVSSLSDDATCAVGGGSNALLPLGPLQVNGYLGGVPLPTHLPLQGSAAIDAGAGQYCPPTDQRGAARPAGAACDVGAVETAAVVPWLWLPLLTR